MKLTEEELDFLETQIPALAEAAFKQIGQLYLLAVAFL
jgi:hypothetical protein